MQFFFKVFPMYNDTLGSKMDACRFVMYIRISQIPHTSHFLVNHY